MGSWGESDWCLWMTVPLIQRHISSTRLFPYHADIISFSDIYSERFNMDHSQYLSELLLLAFFSSGGRQSLHRKDSSVSRRDGCRWLWWNYTRLWFVCRGQVTNSSSVHPVVSSDDSGFTQGASSMLNVICGLFMFFFPKDVIDAKEEIEWSLFNRWIGSTWGKHLKSARRTLEWGKCMMLAFTCLYGMSLIFFP